MVQAGEHIQCLDLFQIASSPGTGKPFCDCAILLEIWDTGGLLQTNVAIPCGAEISIPSIGGGIQAKVVSCQQDDFGYMVEILVCDQEWFPEVYTPPYVLHDRLES
jgi:hypothetical protein